MLRRTLFAAVATLSLMAGAYAAPVVSDPNFNQTPTTAGGGYYGIAAWNATNSSGNPSYAGSVPFDTNNQWNNGTPANGQTTVGFINASSAATPGYIYQDVSGFVAGQSYVITLLANGRVVMPAQTPTLQVTVAAQVPVTAAPAAFASPMVVYNAAMPPVAAVGDTTTPFTLVATNGFTATASTYRIQISDQGPTGSSVLLSGFAIQQASAVPEPVSLVLLGTGLAAVAVLRRRR